MSHSAHTKGAIRATIHRACSGSLPDSCWGAGALKQLQLAHGGFTVEGTPRRLVIQVSQLAHRQPQASERIRGPPAKASSIFAIWNAACGQACMC